MVTRTFVTGLMLILLLGVQAIFLPGTAGAYCCSCTNPCGNTCTCRGSQSCPTCHGGGDSLFQAHVRAIIPGSAFSISEELPSVTLPATDFSVTLTEYATRNNLAIGTSTSRFLPDAEFRLTFWCPGSEKKSV